MENTQSSALLTFLHTRKFLIIIGVFLILGLSSIFFYSVFSQPEKQKIEITPEARYIPDEILVKFQEGVSPNDPEIASKLKELGVVSSERLDSESTGELQYYYKLILKEGSNVSAVHDELYKLDGVQLSQPNYEVGIYRTVNDSSYSSMWGLQKIDMERAWDITTGSNNVKVAVIDTGIDYNHPDLPRNILKQSTNTYADPIDEHAHGTHVAGTIGALTNNAVGVSGINWSVQLMAYKVFGASGSTNDPAVIAATIGKAAREGADIINMSLGKDVPCSNDPLFQDAINEANALGSLVIVAAGNGGADKIGDDVRNASPASCNGVLTVGAVDQNDSRASFSNHGTGIDIAAPGVGILSTWLANSRNPDPQRPCKGAQYCSIGGTSMATPHVAGVAALLLAQNSSMTAEDLKRCIIESGDTIVTDKPLSGKRLNAFNALNGCKENDGTTDPPPTNDNPPPADSGDPDQQVDKDYYIKGIAFADANKNLKQDAGENPVSGISLTLRAEDQINTQVTGSDGSFSFPNLESKIYLFTATANNSSIMEYIFTLDSTMSSYNIPIPIPPISGDDPNILPDDRSLIDGELTPTPTPRKLYTCVERTEERNINNRTVQLKYLDCNPK